MIIHECFESDEMKEYLLAHPEDVLMEDERILEEISRAIKKPELVAV